MSLKVPVVFVVFFQVCRRNLRAEGEKVLVKKMVMRQVHDMKKERRSYWKVFCLVYFCCPILCCFLAVIHFVLFHHAVQFCFVSLCFPILFYSIMLSHFFFCAVQFLSLFHYALPFCLCWQNEILGHVLSAIRI